MNIHSRFPHLSTVSCAHGWQSVSLGLLAPTCTKVAVRGTTPPPLDAHAVHSRQPHNIYLEVRGRVFEVGRGELEVGGGDLEVGGGDLEVRGGDLDVRGGDLEVR